MSGKDRQAWRVRRAVPQLCLRRDAQGPHRGRRFIARAITPRIGISRDQRLSELVEPCAETTWRARGEFLRGGTNSSNPSPSSGESTNFRFPVTSVSRPSVIIYSSVHAAQKWGARLFRAMRRTASCQRKGSWTYQIIRATTSRGSRFSEPHPLAPVSTKSTSCPPHFE